MKAFLISLAVAALCVQAVQSLQCYTCTSATSNSQCLKSANCSESQTYCETRVIKGGIGALSIASITKSCSSACTSSNMNILTGGTFTSCCQTDLCNVSGAMNVKISYLVLIVSVGFIGTLLRAGV